MGILIKIGEWASRIRPDDPMTMSNLSDAADIIRQITGWW